MEKKVSKTFLKVIGIAGSFLLTIYAGLFAMVSLSALFLSVIEKDFISVVACVASAFLSWIFWSVRKDVLL